MSYCKLRNTGRQLCRCTSSPRSELWTTVKVMCMKASNVSAHPRARAKHHLHIKPWDTAQARKARTTNKGPCESRRWLCQARQGSTPSAEDSRIIKNYPTHAIANSTAMRATSMQKPKKGSCDSCPAELHTKESQHADSQRDRI